MARAKGGPKTRRRIKRILKRTSGYRRPKSTLRRQAIEALRRAGRYSYRDRKRRKRDFRNLWVIRIGIAAKEQGLSYSSLMGRLGKAKVGLNRKMLSELAIHDPKAFAQVVELAKSV